MSALDDPALWAENTRIINREGRLKKLLYRPEQGRPGWIVPAWWIDEHFDCGGSRFLGDDVLRSDWRPLDAATVASLFHDPADGEHHTCTECGLSDEVQILHIQPDGTWRCVEHCPECEEVFEMEQWVDIDAITPKAQPGRWRRFIDGLTNPPPLFPPRNQRGLASSPHAPEPTPMSDADADAYLRPYAVNRTNGDTGYLDMGPSTNEEKHDQL